MKTTYLRNKLLDHITGVATYTKPTNTYVGLLVHDPTLDGNLTSELSGGSYARQQASWNAADDGIISIDTEIEFTNLPSNRIKYWAIFDASTNGNMLEYFPFEIPIIVPASGTFTIDAEKLMLKEE